MTAHPNQTQASIDVLNESQNESFPYTMDALGLEIEVHKDVFSPKHFNGWRVFTQHFPDVAGKRVLELGTGPGVTALHIAKRGAQHVVAADISKAAVVNTQANIDRHQLTNIEARESDVYSGLAEDEQFDIIYWNTPFMYAEPDYEYPSIRERGLFDPGYRITERFLKDAHQHLTQDGYVLVGFGNFGDEARLKDLTTKHKFTVATVVRESSTEIHDVEFVMFKLTPTT